MTQVRDGLQHVVDAEILVGHVEAVRQRVLADHRGHHLLLAAVEAPLRQAHHRLRHVVAGDHGAHLQPVHRAMIVAYGLIAPR